MNIQNENVKKTEKALIRDVVNCYLTKFDRELCFPAFDFVQMEVSSDDHTKYISRCIKNFASQFENFIF